MTDNPADTFPGWYADPRGEADQRFWNGREWTPNTRTDAPVATPTTPKRVEPERSDPVAVAPSLVEANSENGEAESGRARIFGGPPSGAAVATKDAAKAEPTNIEEVKAEPIMADVVKAETAKVETAKKPVAEPVAVPAKAEADNSLFGKTNGSTSDGTSKIVNPDKELTARIDNDSLLQKTANRPAIAPVTPAAAPPSIIGKLLGSGLLFLLVGGLIGWAIGRSGNDSSTTGGTETTVEVVDEQDDAGSVTTSDSEVVGTDDATAELQTTVDDLNSDLDAATAEVDALALERDNAIEHNEILQTWFTADVRANSDRAWELGVQRACSAEADPTIENTDYTRAMELVGTHADLVTAALVCRSEG